MTREQIAFALHEIDVAHHGLEPWEKLSWRSRRGYLSQAEWVLAHFDQKPAEPYPVERLVEFLRGVAELASKLPEVAR